MTDPGSLSRRLAAAVFAHAAGFVAIGQAARTAADVRWLVVLAGVLGLVAPRVPGWFDALAVGWAEIAERDAGGWCDDGIGWRWTGDKSEG